MSLSTTNSEEGPEDNFKIESIYDKLYMLNSEDESEDFSLRQDTLSLKSDATVVLPKLNTEDVLKDLMRVKVYEIRLEKWVLFLRTDFKDKGLKFLKEMQDTAQQMCSFLIEEPQIQLINDYLTSMEYIESYLKASVNSIDPIKLFIAIIPSFNANAIYIKLKNLSTSCPITSQMIQESTLSRRFPLPDLIESLKVKLGANPYTNPRNLLGLVYQNGQVADIESKLIEGTVLVPHEPRYFSDEGMRRIRGKIIIAEDGTEHVLDYEKTSLVNWPTFYPDDVVEFRVKFNPSFTHFAVCDLMLKPRESFEKSKETRIRGTLHNYELATHIGVMICDDGRKAAFRRDEILLDSNYNLSTDRDRRYEFSLFTTSLGYNIAIRILML